MSKRNLTSESMKLEMHGMKSEIADLRAQLAASQEGERILRKVVVEVKETSASALQTTCQTRFNKYFLHFIQLTADVLEKAREVKG